MSTKNIKLFSTSMLYTDAINGYKSSPIKYYRRKSSIYPHLKALYGKALRSQKEEFITEAIARSVVRTYYKTRVQDTGVDDPKIIAKAAADFATMYNITKTHHISAKFDMPDLTSLTDIIEWIGTYIRKFIRGSLEFGITVGTIIGIGTILTSGYFTALPILIASSALVVTYIYAQGMIYITREMWQEIKNMMKALGVLDRDKRVSALVRNTETYKSYNEAIKIVEKYKGKELPKDQAIKVKVLIEQANDDAKEFLNLAKGLKRDIKEAEKKMKERNKG